LTFASPSETQQVPCVRSTPSPPIHFPRGHKGQALVARRLRFRPDSSLGVFQSPPLHRHLHRASTPGPTSFEGDLPFGSDLPGSELVPPLPFLPAPTVFSARRSTGLLHPAAGHGVRHISRSKRNSSRGWHRLGFDGVATASPCTDHDPEGPRDSNGLASPCHLAAWPEESREGRVNPLSQPTSSTRARDGVADVAADHPRRGVTTSISRPDPHQLRGRASAPSPLSQTWTTAGAGRDHFPTPCLSLWRITLRRFPLVSSRTASPRPLPSRRQPLPDPRRVTATKIKEPPRPQGLAPLPRPLRGPVLPPHLARSSLGLAYQIEPDPEANRRPVGPPGQARRRCPPPKHASGEGNPHPNAFHRHRSTREPTSERRCCRPETDQPPSAAARSGRGGFRSPWPGAGRRPSQDSAFVKDQGGCFLCHYGRATRLQLGSGRSHDPPCAGFTAGPRGAPNRSSGAPPPLRRRSDAAAEAARVARSSTRRASPRRRLRQRDRRDDQGHAPFRQR